MDWIADHPRAQVLKWPLNGNPFAFSDSSPSLVGPSRGFRTVHAHVSGMELRQEHPQSPSSTVSCDAEEKTDSDEDWEEAFYTPESRCPSVPEQDLSIEQQHVLDTVLRGQSVFFTGSAGTGKSFLLRSIIKQLRSRDNDLTAVTASTGIAAVNIGGVTLHSWAGIRLGKESAEILAQNCLKNTFTRDRWRNTDTLIIDEISMVDGSLFDKLDFIGRVVRGIAEPFGGLQLVVSGDFFQLPPVPDKMDGVSQPIAFAFEAACWNAAIPNCYTLTHVFRQKEQEFVDMLNEIRMGKLTHSALEAFRKLDRPLPFKDCLQPTQLFPLRGQVQNANQDRLAVLPGEPHTYLARDFPGFDSRGDPISQERATKLLDQSVIALAQITLKVGAQVMLIQNVEQGHLVNGSVGRIEAFQTVGQAQETGHDIARMEEPQTAIGQPRRPSDRRGQRESHAPTSGSWPLVKFENGMTLLVQPTEFALVNARGKKEAQRDQVPLILAWALSIHKSQGQTLQRVRVDLSTAFEKGQAYVALSRATSLAGLEVRGFVPSRVMAHPRVLQWARSLSTFPMPSVSSTLPNAGLVPRYVVEEDWGIVDDEELIRAYQGPY